MPNSLKLLSVSAIKFSILEAESPLSSKKAKLISDWGGKVCTQLKQAYSMVISQLPVIVSESLSKFLDTYFISKILPSECFTRDESLLNKPFFKDSQSI